MGEETKKIFGKMEDEEIEEKKDEKEEIPDELPVLFLRDIVVFPFMAVPLQVGRERSKVAVEEAIKEKRMILLVSQKDAAIEDPKKDDVYKVGTVAMVLRMLKLSNGNMRIFVHGISRAKVDEYIFDKTHTRAKISVIKDKETKIEDLKLEALKRSVKKSFEEFIELGKQLPPEILFYIQDIDEPGKLADNLITYLSLKVPELQELLELFDPIKRLEKVYEYLIKEIRLLKIQQEISSKAKEEIDNMQREYYLRQQLKAIKEQLGEANEIEIEIKEYRKKMEEVELPPEAKEEVEKQLSRLEKMHPESAESNVIRTYLDWMLSLPWKKSTKDNLNIKRAKKILDEDHYDLEKVKERIVEYLAVRKLKKDSKGPILCFVGPPGVGKTSLGKSIARALGRKFVRMSLGGIRDEAEIRGHRRTYVGALPGRIIQGIKQAGSNNPVFMLDEVDKIGSDFRGDPSSALLEVLDPEQNNAFVDNYLGVPFDLSNVMFIATANVLHTIQPAFLDRMEVIHLPGYTEEEKIHIAKKYLIPKQIKENGLKKGQIIFTEKAIRKIITDYTREAGVRNLERQIGSVCRKVAKRIAEGKIRKYRITEKNLEKYLGNPKVFHDQLLKEDKVGVAVGLAWTEAGGDILFIEANMMKGKGNLILTGSLGDVMKESAQTSLSYLRANSKKYGIDEDKFLNVDVHVHVPEGAIPKDGPSAGITIFTSLYSLFTGRRVKRDTAMTGEITLQGRVLPVGGIKEKVLAAKRAGIKKVIMPEYNKKDLDDVPSHVKKSMEFVFVENVDQVIKEAIRKKK